MGVQWHGGLFLTGPTTTGQEQGPANSICRYSPRCGSGPKCRLQAPPLHDPLPPTQPGPPPAGALHKEPKGGLGGRGEGRAGREGVWLEGRVLQLQCGMGGPSKHQLGPDPHLGAPNICRYFLGLSGLSSVLDMVLPLPFAEQRSAG